MRNALDVRTIAALATAGMVVVLARPAPAQSRCTKARYAAAGQAADAKASCAARAAGKGAPVDPSCLAKADAKLAERWARALAKGDCPTAIDVATVQDLVDGFAATLTATLEPPLVSHCCDVGASCFAAASIDQAICAFELLGTPGPPGSVCDGATGDCVLPPGTGGPCCALSSLSVCSAGPTLDPADCFAAGGLDYPMAVCVPSGTCEAR